MGARASDRAPWRVSGCGLRRPRDDPPGIEGELLAHTHWSSVSGLKDEPENYQEVTYELAGSQGQTELTVSEVNLPSEDAKGVSEKAWMGALSSLKRTLET